MSVVTNLETKLDQWINTDAPQLPEGGKKALFRWAPTLALIVGLLSAVAAISLWATAHVIHKSTYVVQQLCSTYQSSGGDCNIPGLSHLNFWVWLAIICLIVQAVLYLRAYNPLREQRKTGWNYLYYATLTNAAYTVITLFTGFDVFGHFFGALIGLIVTFYLLFQIRSFFKELPATNASRPSVPELHQAEIVKPTISTPAVTDKPKARKVTAKTKTKSTTKKKRTEPKA